MKKILSVVLCAVLLLGALSIPALAVNAEDYAALPYKNYCYLGDSISWGYGLDPNMDNHDKFSLDKRVPGSFTDIIAGVLEQNNGATVHPAASSGLRRRPCCSSAQPPLLSFPGTAGRSCRTWRSWPPWRRTGF